MIKIKITAFGALGKLTISEPMVIEIASGTKLFETREQIKKEILKISPQFNDFAVLEKSALADDREVLGKDHIFDRDTNLAILPPICGG
ncbi:MAG: hypothetical protein A2887_02205 [Alphaproteobacteria bacterium RIFCSPLOWO2_01_FULL_40_26]|nr:MAG: hypothetical protein A3D15_02975 [Alphaproteobacteria bacterium RIFCSPHIGHO2_02_FULL_40_34]OFW85470.1 MAG: hypothetical protein A2794_00030 [Alphaproteobacteria bacterium RIFCSPHIGHO2_01_FULL_40_8]OFW94780.1 MAG: hypothetical protein A2887_02205 [Alphaproteobacteria bacterium RIFCSPLOWO2_01_FULL_40_26]OFX10409.1 MAG: hypothetical protein A3H30_03200 [Alphaproteobacteria bacterium RIFCSPLOWO2_02_FULL_40_19]OFX11289.1 MAG: hypothetical protein A3G22_06090 [Alphaproteobacteria bacterium RI